MAPNNVQEVIISGAQESSEQRPPPAVRRAFNWKSIQALFLFLYLILPFCLTFCLTRPATRWAHSSACRYCHFIGHQTFYYATSRVREELSSSSSHLVVMVQTCWIMRQLKSGNCRLPGRDFVDSQTVWSLLRCRMIFWLICRLLTSWLQHKLDLVFLSPFLILILLASQNYWDALRQPQT